MVGVPFSQIKLQHLRHLASDRNVTDRAFRLAAYLALNHSNHVTGLSRPTDAYVAEAMGVSVKTVSRAAKALAESGHYTVERGVNRGTATRYTPTDAAIRRAIDLRKKDDKVVTLSPAKALQKCPESPTELSEKARQSWGANREKELRKEHEQARGTALPRNGQADAAAYWAAQAKAGAFVPQTAISSSLSREITSRGLLEPDELKAIGVAV